MITNPNRILWPTDFSPLSLSAAEVVRNYAKVFGAELHVIHVAPLYVWDGVTEMATAGDTLTGQVDLRGPAEGRLREVVRQCFGDTRVVLEILIGTPWVEICSYATEKSVDLILISTHGFTGLKHVLMGSVAERVVQHADCSILVVKSLRA